MLANEMADEIDSDWSSVASTRSQQEKRKRMIDFLVKQSAVFSGFIESSEKPKEVSVRGRRRMSVDKSEEDDAALTQTDVDFIHLQTQPSCIKGTMRSYQLDALNWLLHQYQLGLNSILADEMGLGKTLETISILGFLKQYLHIDGPHLIVVPKSTLGNWIHEINQFCPSLRAMRYHGSKEERVELSKGIREKHRTWDIVVTTYEMCIIEKATFRSVEWCYVVVDEAHRLKNENSKLSTILRHFSVMHRLLLTGTPLQNNLHELWALLNFLMPEVFGSQDMFHRLFNLEEDASFEEKEKIIHQLHQILEPFMLRRLKSDVEHSLPPKIETILYVGMSSLQKELYKKVLVNDYDSIINSKAERSHLMNMLMQLRKVAAHPYLFNGVEDRTLDPMGEHVITNCGKMVLLDKLLKRLKEKGSRVLLFSQMCRVLDILEDYCNIRGFEYCRIDGSTNSLDREEAIASFNAPNSTKFVFLLSTRAGGLGINLATADTVILYDSDWNPQMDLQAEDRAHRIGQKKTVNIYRLVTEGTVEEMIVERAKLKLRLDTLVIQQGRLHGKSALSKDEMMEIVRHGANEVFLSTDNGIQDEDIDHILESGQQRTEALTRRVEKALPSDDQLLNFKIDHPSIFVYEGIDYTEKRKELKQLVMNEVTAVNDTRRTRNGVTYVDVNSQHDDNKSHKTRSVVKLPAMFPHQFYQKQRIEELAAIAQKNFEDPSYDHTTNKLLSEEQEMELEKLLSEGFDTWKKADMMAYVQAVMDYGLDEYDQIAEAIGTKTPEEVMRYAEIFWRRGPEEIAGFAKIAERVEKSASRREEVSTYRRIATERVLGSRNPWELEVGHGRQAKYSPEADTFLVICIALYGWGQWSRIRRAINQEPRLQFDFFLRSRTDAELMKRAEVVLKAMKRDVQEVTPKQQQLQQQLNAEKEMLESEYRSIELEEAKLKEEEQKIDEEILSLQKELESKRNEIKQTMEEPRPVPMKPTLQSFNLSSQQLISLLPFIDALIAGVRGSIHEIEKFLHQRMPTFSHRFLKDFLAVVARKTERSMFMLTEDLLDKERNCVKLDGVIAMTDEVRKTCNDLAEYARVNGRQILDVKQWYQQQENYMAAIKNKLIQYVTVHYPVRTDQITSEQALAEMQLSSAEVWSCIYSVLCVVEDNGVAVWRPKQLAIKREAPPLDVGAKRADAVP